MVLRIRFIKWRYAAILLSSRLASYDDVITFCSVDIIYYIYRRSKDWNRTYVFCLFVALKLVSWQNKT